MKSISIFLFLFCFASHLFACEDSAMPPRESAEISLTVSFLRIRGLHKQEWAKNFLASNVKFPLPVIYRHDRSTYAKVTAIIFSGAPKTVVPINSEFIQETARSLVTGSGKIFSIEKMPTEATTPIAYVSKDYKA